VRISLLQPLPRIEEAARRMAKVVNALRNERQPSRPKTPETAS
jgi:hypothetical protein